MNLAVSVASLIASLLESLPHSPPNRGFASARRDPRAQDISGDEGLAT